MDMSKSKNSYLQGAAAYRKKLAAEAQTKRMEDEELNRAFEELERRQYLVSFPDYAGDDSFAQIREDKETLEEYVGSLPRSEEALQQLGQNDPEPPDSKNLSAIA